MKFPFTSSQQKSSPNLSHHPKKIIPKKIHHPSSPSSPSDAIEGFQRVFVATELIPQCCILRAADRLALDGVATTGQVRVEGQLEDLAMFFEGLGMLHGHTSYMYV